MHLGNEPPRFTQSMAGLVAAVTFVAAVLSMAITASIIHFADAMDIMPLGLTIAVTCCVLVTPPVTYFFQRQTLELEAAHVELRAMHAELGLTHVQLTDLHGKLHAAYREMERRANHDGMTGLANREAFLSRLSSMKRKSDYGYVLMIDADKFKRINDEHGHDAGDRAIKAIAEAISNSIRAEDLGARIGGEEFAVILRHSGLEEATAVAERVRSQVEKTPISMTDGARLRVTVSVGGAAFNGTAAAEEVLRTADAQLYEAKSRGRNRVCIESSAVRAA